MLKKRSISIGLCLLMFFLMMFTSFQNLYVQAHDGVPEPDSRSTDVSSISNILQRDPNFSSIIYMQNIKDSDIPFEHTLSHLPSIDSVLYGPKGLYYVDRGSGWIRNDDKDLIATSGIQNNGVARISTKKQSTFGYTTIGSISTNISFLEALKLGFEFAYRRNFKRNDTISVDYSMETEPMKSLYLKAYRTNRKIEIYKKDQNGNFVSLNTVYEPDGSWLKPTFFKQGDKLDLDKLIEREERCVLYPTPKNYGDDEYDNRDNKAKLSVLNKNKELLFDINIDKKNVVSISNAQNRQLDNEEPNSEFFKFSVYDKNTKKERISISLNGYENAYTSDKLRQLQNFKLTENDAITIFHKYSGGGSMIFNTILTLGHGSYIEIPTDLPMAEALLEDFYFEVIDKGLCMEEKNPSRSIDDIKNKLSKNIPFGENKEAMEMYRNTIYKSLKDDINSKIDTIDDLILNGDYEEIIEIQTDESGNPIKASNLDVNKVKAKEFVPTRDGQYIVNRGEGWISSENVNKITNAIVPPKAISTISRTEQLQEDYIFDINFTATFTKEKVTAILKLGAGPIIGASNTVTVGGSNQKNNTQSTFMKAYGLNRKLEVLNVVNGKVTDKVLYFKPNGHWIVPITFNQEEGLNQNDYVIKNNTKVLNYEDIYEGYEVLPAHIEVLNEHMKITPNTNYYKSKDGVENLLALKFTVDQDGTYSFKNKMSRWDYMYYAFSQQLVDRPTLVKRGYNFPIQILEVDADNVRRINSVVYSEYKKPIAGGIANVPDKYGDAVSVDLKSGKTYLYVVNTDGVFGYGEYQSSGPTTIPMRYLIKKRLELDINKK